MAPRPPVSLRTALPAMAAAALLAACGTVPTTPRPPDSPQVVGERDNIVLYAMGMVDTDYRFGGKNPEAGFDCSGVVSYVYRVAVGIDLTGSAADIARRGREIDKRDLRPGDLVFFDTLGRRFSHVGIYIGNGRFIDAPATNEKVRIDSLDNPYFARHFEMARSYLD